ncbi:MAG: DUF429 domain-containing protein [Dehalococcoidia bacterium]|nr:DUF429 domain-containing protein [Dehalococcoidia bacterium]
MSPHVLGLDGYPGGWVVAAIREGELTSVSTAPHLSDVLPADGVACIAIDMPMAFPVGGRPRPAEAEARSILGRRASSVFPTPSREVLEEPTHAGAIRRARELGLPAPSAQSFALRPKILEAAPLAEADDRLIEVHPELSFHVLKGGALEYAKRTWNGLHERSGLLEAAGIVVPAHIDASAPADDVLDAAVAALTALRHAQGTSSALPRQPVPGRSRRDRIWLPA